MIKQTTVFQCVGYFQIECDEHLYCGLHSISIMKYDLLMLLLTKLYFDWKIVIVDIVHILF